MNKLFIALLAISMTACSSSKQTNTTPQQEHLVGAYTDQHNVSKEAKAIFDKTYTGTRTLTPVSVATQVVAGTNYDFICVDSVGKRYEIKIYEPLPCDNKAPEITSFQILK